jgi:dTMP kinase
LLTSDQEEVSFLTLLKNRNFLKLFLAQSVSSLGDWIGVIAIATLAYNLNGNAGVGAVMTARVLPGFIAGPIAGVLADSYDRRKIMIVADLCRAALIFSLPFMPNLLYLLFASVVMESLTLAWGPAKDASLPHVVPASHFTHANSLNLIAVYAPWPIASVVYTFMSTLGSFMGRTVPALEGLEAQPEALALWLDSVTFCFSALMIWSLHVRLSGGRRGRLDWGQVKSDLMEGVRFVVEHKQVRPWLLGIAFTFTAAGAVFSLGVGFVTHVLGGGDRGFALLIGFLGTGMIIGLLAVGFIARFVHKDVLFSSSLLLLGLGLIGLASVGNLGTAIPIASALGFFGGAAYSTGYSLMHETTVDELRGRTFSAGYAVIRIGTLAGLGLFPLLAGAIGDHEIDLPGSLGTLFLPGSRTALWIAGLAAFGGGLMSMRAISHRGRPHGFPQTGTFIVFEGGEGAGKSTQMTAFVQWLEANGADVVTTREPGGTPIGERLREVLLDPSSSSLDPRAEALLYAADRAQHVAQVIQPALDAGRIVVSDRYVDSSLAYQGLARGLGLNEILNLSSWATGGLLPDLVFFLNVDAGSGLERSTGEPDRLEGEGEDFHRRVNAAYLELAERWPGRFVVLDASRPKGEVHADVVKAFKKRFFHGESALAEAAAMDLHPPGPPVPR